MVVYDKDQEGQWRLAHEDSGFVVRDARGPEVFITRMPEGKLLEWEGGHIRVRCPSRHAQDHETDTPRLLDMKVQRIRWVAERLSSLIVRRPVKGKCRAPITLVREVVLKPERTRIMDEVVDERRASARTRRTLYWRLNSVCNLHCKMCDIGNPNPDSNCFRHFCGSWGTCRE